MDYFLEITKKVEAFCNIQPYPDSRLDYLKSAGEIRQLYLDAILITEDDDIQNIDKKLLEIYNKISKIID